MLAWRRGGHSLSAFGVAPPASFKKGGVGPKMVGAVGLETDLEVFVGFDFVTRGTGCL